MPKNKPKFIILDRDGVINEDLWGYVKSIEEFQPIEGSIEAIAKLTKAGFHIVVVTNQACINKKIINVEKLNEVHSHMKKLIEDRGGKLSFIAFCPHTPEEKCSCRKPETGLLTQVEENLSIKLKGSYFIGDKETDLLCAIKFGCIPLLVETGYGDKTLKSISNPNRVSSFPNLSFAVDYILGL